MRPNTLTDRSIEVTCHCGKAFFAYKTQIEKGFDRNCSRRCRDIDPIRLTNASVATSKFFAPKIKSNIAAKRLRCRRCDTLKPKTDFVKDKTRPHGYFPWCKECHKSKQKQYSKIVVMEQASGNCCPVCLISLGEAHPNRIYCGAKCKGRAKRWEHFGLTPDNFRELTASGKCPLCYCNVTRWAIDHNHETGETTGPVCHRCNQYLLAGSKHKLEIAKALVSYLDNPPVRRLLGEKRYVGPNSSSKLHRMWLWTGRVSEEDICPI